MPFYNMKAPKYPRRQWSLVGFPSTGKSTFAAQMRQPGLVIDADHRFSEILRQYGGDFFALSENPEDNTQARRIAHRLREGMSGSGIKTITVDSLTAIIAPLVMEAMLSNKEGENTNRVAAFSDKALAIRTIQDAVTGYGTDTLWIYHLQEGRDNNANKHVTTSISPVELARLRRSLNMDLRTVQNGGKYGVKVEWAREGRSGVILYDDSGTWAGMPEKIEQAVYDGLTADEIAALATRKSFAGPADAIAWGYETGAFRDAVHAQNAYDELRKDKAPRSAGEMWDLWIADVNRRMAEMPAESPEMTY